MKRITAFICSIIFLQAIYAQQAPTPQILKEPANWEFETFPLPPSFAPGIPYKGVEELRFSPGMFKKDSATYFTYAFVAVLDSTSIVSEKNIKDYLFDYFKGLCSSTAKQRQLVIDTSKITVSIEKKKHSGGDAFYDATLNIYGVFADGAPVKLNMEIKVMYNKTVSKAYVVVIASPLDKANKIWITLRGIQQGVKV
ncbi:MAG: hypothetical protein QM726_23155 [Chitinophagaceae bacterium]